MSPTRTSPERARQIRERAAAVRASLKRKAHKEREPHKVKTSLGG